MDRAGRGSGTTGRQGPASSHAVGNGHSGPAVATTITVIMVIQGIAPADASCYTSGPAADARTRGETERESRPDQSRNGRRIGTGGGLALKGGRGRADSVAGPPPTTSLDGPHGRISEASSGRAYAEERPGRKTLVEKQSGHHGWGINRSIFETRPHPWGQGDATDSPAFLPAHVSTPSSTCPGGASRGYDSRGNRSGETTPEIAYLRDFSQGSFLKNVNKRETPALNTGRGYPSIGKSALRPTHLG